MRLLRLGRLGLVALALTRLAACSEGPREPAPERLAEDRSRIIGGGLDLFRTYVVGVGDATGAFCTGTVISRRTVLTAGHCYGGITKIFLGDQIAPSKKPKTVAVIKEVRHPNYNDNTLSHDLTVLELGADAPTQPAPMLRETMDASYVGPNFTFVGYGNDGAMNYDVRRVVTFPITAVGPAQVGTTTGSGPIDDSEFYYDAPNKNTCDGDSGGPSFVARGHVERLAGTTSFGDQDCMLDGVNARADAPAIKAFIQPYIDQFEDMDPCRADGVCDETCNKNNTLLDPDCAENHCGADGMCVISCVAPLDPDCTGVNHCAADGVCDPSCAPVDADCLPPSSSMDGGAPDSDAPDGGSSDADLPDSGVFVPDGGSIDAGPTDGGVPSTGVDGGASTGSDAGGSETHGVDGGPEGGNGDKGGCGCRAAGSEGGGSSKLALVATTGALVFMRRRRRSTRTR